MLASAMSILLLALGVLVIRYGQFKYPANEASESDDGKTLH
jgi:hypothetical protein